VEKTVFLETRAEKGQPTFLKLEKQKRKIDLSPYLVKQLKKWWQ